MLSSPGVSGIVFRWANLLASIGLVGIITALLLAGPGAHPTARAWQRRMRRRACWMSIVVLVSAVAWLAERVVVLEQTPAALLVPGAFLRVALDTQVGVVWVTRLGLLALVTATIALVPDGMLAIDRRIVRGELLFLAGMALALVAASGHALGADAAGAVTVDALHIVAVGVWLGALLPVAALVRAGSDEHGADARPGAVVTARRLSRFALVAVTIAIATGVVNTTLHVGGIPALIGTPYGRLLVAKLAVLVILLGIAVRNRRLLPALSAHASLAGRTMRQLARSLEIEAAVAAVLLGIVAVMATTTPARHEEPVWPLPFRLSWEAGIAAAPVRLLAASQLAVLGAVVALAATRAPAFRRAAMAAAGASLGSAVALGVPPMAVEAYPTSYRRPPVAYAATSIAAGASLHAEHCARCHDDDLASARVGQRTAGELFWILTAGHRGAAVLASRDALDDDQRWDVVNYLRARQAGAAARDLGASVEPDRAWLVAPNFTITVGPGASRTLRDYRGQRIVLLVFYSLPASRERLAELAQHHRLLGVLGVEVVAVPTDAAPDALRQLGDSPPVLFPVVTDEAEPILATYRLFADAPHSELLVDRQGYLRARWLTTPDANAMLAAIEQLRREPVAAAPAADHVH
jgi:putative copper resistance protein D